MNSGSKITRDNHHLLALIALSNIEGVGSKRLAIIADLSDPLRWLDSSLHRQQFCKGLPQATRATLSSFLRAPQMSPEWELAWRSLEWLRAQGASIWLKTDPDFPASLLELNDCPAMLYRLGKNLDLFNKPALSIVGTRKPTHAGARFARELAAGLSSVGFTIVSGMAVGIDTAAHSGALDAGGNTIAVWATGLDKPYPLSNRALAQKIIEQGCVLTEMPLSTPPLAGCFPRRNRIVSGLAAGVIVVEASEKSGSMITARLAMEQNREVFAVPGAVNNPQAKGCHQLLREGACLTTGVDDVLENLSGFVSRSLLAPEEQVEREVYEPLPPELEAVYRLLSDQMEPFELLLSRANTTSEALAAALVDLELMSLVTADAGCYARR